jgi:hypothetical protein
MTQRQTAYSAIDNIGKQRQLTDEEKQELAILQDTFFNCFNTEAGKKVLEHLEDKHLKKPVAVPGMGEVGNQFAYYREGENNAIRYIKTLIKQSEKRRQNK